MAGPAPVLIVAPRNPDQRAITAYFMAQHAIAPGDAIPYSPGTPGEREQFGLMAARGIIKQAGQGYYWLDTIAYTQDSRTRQAKLGAAAALIAVILAVALMFLYQDGGLTPP